MLKLSVFILQFIILLFVSAVFSSEVVNQDMQVDQKVTSLNEGNISKVETVSDYSNNELARSAVNKYIRFFTEKIRERFSLWLMRSGRYIELMKVILKEKGLPEEIVFLSLIESGFSPYAYSPQRAVGYWQFIASTAKRYGLEINWWKDERRDPVKSTRAAASYLKDLYEMFGSWNLAMAAYNAGEGKILRALKKANTYDYWSLRSTGYIKEETKDYVPKFIAASLIANSPREFGFEDIEYYPPLDYDEVVIQSPLDLETVAACAETEVDVIKKLNPELRRWCTPLNVREYTLRIPRGKKDIFLENLARIPKERRFSIDIYKVKKGDTLKKIAKKTGIPLQVILHLNPIERIKPFKEGIQIYLPPKGRLVLDRDDMASIKKVLIKKKAPFKAKMTVKKRRL